MRSEVLREGRAGIWRAILDRLGCAASVPVGSCAGSDWRSIGLPRYVGVFRRASRRAARTFAALGAGVTSGIYDDMAQSAKEGGTRRGITSTTWWPKHRTTRSPVAIRPHGPLRCEERLCV